MPHYRWLACDAQNTEYEGTLWAVTSAMVNDELAKHGLRLITVTQKPLMSRGQRWSTQQALYFFEQWHQLLATGLLVPHALQIMSSAGTTTQRALAQELQQGLAHGGTLTAIMQQLPQFFDGVVITLIGSAHDAPTLAVVLERVITMLRMRIAVRKQVWQALTTPLLTLGFFVAVVLIIFIAIVPSLHDVVAVTGQRAPDSVATLFAISDWLHAYGLAAAMAFAGAIFGIWVFFALSAAGKKCGYWFLVTVPGVATLYCDMQWSFIFQALGILVSSGLEIAVAIEQISALTRNPYIRQHLIAMGDLIALGNTPAQAYDRVLGLHAFAHVSAMLTVGQQAGALARMSEYAGRFYLERAQRRLQRFVLLLQPTLMIMLGLLIAALLYAIYTPLVQLPEMVNQTII